MPMGMADIAAVLWGRFLRVDPGDPEWPDRDRFVISNGHGSMLLYAVLHLSGFPITMEDLRNFRQWGYPTAGHPEIEQARGIETTTGPLGQGFANGVGMAIAETHLRDKFGSDLVDHRIFGFVSDGDLMEGVASEAASLAGHLGLGRIVYFYDDNGISLVGPTSWSFSDDVPKRFDSYGWQTATIDGHDRGAIADAIETAIADERPTLISCKTHIGFGSPNVQDTAAAHGQPLGFAETELVRKALGWPYEPFVVPAEVYEFFSTAMERGSAARSAWEARRLLAVADSSKARLWDAHFDSPAVSLEVPEIDPGSSVATRNVSGTVLQQLSELAPALIGGAADLASSTSTLLSSSTDFSVKERAGRNLRFGVREHAMGAIVNGITVHGGLRAYGATFLIFSDYMRGAVRLSALMGVPSIWVWTHDSIFLGQDGPTHQPIEHLAALRAMPNLWVVRPGTPAEVAGAWQLAINRTDGPTALILTRQGLLVPETDTTPELTAQGGYVVRDGHEVVLVTTGSELPLALAAADLLEGEGRAPRVVSMPCVEAFLTQSLEYREDVLGDGLPTVSLEAGATFGWPAITGENALNIGINHYGASAPAEVLADRFGFTPEAVAFQIEAWLSHR